VKVDAGGDDEDVIADINVTPFVDIVLVLLVIFMVTSQYIVQAAIPVELPKAASGGEIVARTINIVVMRDGALLVDGDEIIPKDLPALVQKANAEQQGPAQVVIAADRLAPYGIVIDVIDTVRQNGVLSFALNIERKAAASPSP